MSQAGCAAGTVSDEAYLADFTERWHDLGASAWYRHWLGRIEELRGRVAAFLGTTTRELALLPSTSTALGVVNESVRADGRNRVVITELDFPTLAYQWAVRPEIEVVVLRSPDGVRIDPEQFEAAVDERTLFLATSHVFFTTGYEQAADAFHQGHAAMYYMGSWTTGGFTADVPIASDVVIRPYPGIGGAYDSAYLGGAPDCFMGSALTTSPDEAAIVIRGLAQNISTIGVQTGMTLPMWYTGQVRMEQMPDQSDADYAAVSHVYNQVADLTINPGEAILWWDTLLGNKGTACNELIVKLFAEEITPEEYAAVMDELLKGP